jgi:phosphate/sulfate permease
LEVFVGLGHVDIESAYNRSQRQLHSTAAASVCVASACESEGLGHVGIVSSVGLGLGLGLGSEGLGHEVIRPVGEGHVDIESAYNRSQRQLHSTASVCVASASACESEGLGHAVILPVGESEGLGHVGIVSSVGLGLGLGSEGLGHKVIRPVGSEGLGLGEGPG